MAGFWFVVLVIAFYLGIVLLFDLAETRKPNGRFVDRKARHRCKTPRFPLWGRRFGRGSQWQCCRCERVWTFVGEDGWISQEEVQRRRST